MTKMKSIGVREFRDHATTYLLGTDPVAVSKHGHVIGFARLWTQPVAVL